MVGSGLDTHLVRPEKNSEAMKSIRLLAMQLKGRSGYFGLMKRMYWENGRKGLIPKRPPVSTRLKKREGTGDPRGTFE